MAREEAAGEGVGLGEGEEGGKLCVGPRAEAMDSIGGGEFAERGELRGEGSGGRVGRETDFLLEGEFGEQFVERAEGVEFAVVDDADARA